MKVYKYSIIIPHHNTPKLLSRLLNSIPRREDLEVIIVDDNSDGAIVDFDHFPGMGRPNVQIIFDKAGRYGGYARNLGLSVASGEKILFADSDDFFNYCINDILDDYADNCDDVVYFKANSIDCEKYTNSSRSLLLNEYIDLFNREKEKAGLLLRYKFGEPWCKLIKRELITSNNICFEERSIHNDTAFSYMVGYYAHNISVDNRALYCVTSRENSVSKAITESKKLERIECFALAEKFYIAHNIPIKIYTHYNQLAKSWLTNKSTYREGIQILRRLGYHMSIIRKKVIPFIIYNVISNPRLLFKCR